MNRPDPETILQPLKPFQRRTVDHAFAQLFLDPKGSGRFLVADEVGLGKTLVARGVIARAIDHLWDSVGRIDIVYICSNQSIARANLPKLKVGGSQDRSFALATRLTMLASELAAKNGEPGLADSKLNFVSFTPSTSLQIGNDCGHQQERRLIYQLLEPMLGRSVGLMNLMQGGVQDHHQWRQRLRNKPFELEEQIVKRFSHSFRTEPNLRLEIENTIELWFWRKRARLPVEAGRARRQLIGRLRRMLAAACIESLEPDLIVLDEFQRFKTLMTEGDEASDGSTELARALFQSTTPEGEPVRTLLLSATPYKLYTADAEIEQEDHYEDFLATTRFLMGNDEGRVEQLRTDLSRFGGELKRAALGRDHDVKSARQCVETQLRKIMARTERVSATMEHDAMVKDSAVQLKLSHHDVRQYMAADALFRAVGAQDPMAFWKSAPYLVHFMQDYKVNTQLKQALETTPNRISEVIQRHLSAHLQRQQLEDWQELEAGNAKLRALMTELLDRGLWKLLWIPPTIPYWPLEGAYLGMEGVSKTLLFSAWNVVPDVVSGVLSYEAERRMMGGTMVSYLDPDRQQSPLLRLSQTADGVRSRQRLLLLLLPCLTLADQAHPLTAPPDTDCRSWVNHRVECLLADPTLPDPKDGPVDDRWEMHALLLLDPDLRQFLVWWRNCSTAERPNPEVLPAYIDDLLSIDPGSLGRRPPDLLDLMTDLALGAPGILAARTLLATGLKDSERRQLAVVMAQGFWRLFNRPAVIRLISGMAAPGTETSPATRPYWRQVIDYCKDGNLQSVLDETWHLQWEQLAWGDSQSTFDVARDCVGRITADVEPRPSRVHAHFYSGSGQGMAQEDPLRIRAVFAVRFGKSMSDEGTRSQDDVRAAFNSPFRPFVLASTSIGQEGLDFHPWCHRLVHWNLPGNPVDLEQREGRVHRYKGHAVRKNVAKQSGLEAMAIWRPGQDLWECIFELADQNARLRGDSDLVPYWLATGPHKVERHVPLLPYTEERQAFQRLQKQLAAYRVVFGQPRQEELLSMLETSELRLEEMHDWSIDLAPR